MTCQTVCGATRLNAGRLLCAASLAAMLSLTQTEASTNSQAENGREIVAAKCVDCHALAVVESAHHSNKEWQAVVAAMIARGARVTSEEISIVVEFLSAHFGPPAAEANAAPNLTSIQGRAEADFSTAPLRATITGTVKADQDEVRGFRVTSHNLRYQIWMWCSPKTESTTFRRRCRDHTK